MPGPEEHARIMPFSYFPASIMTPSVCGSYAKAYRRCRESITASHIMVYRADSATIMAPAAVSARIIATPSVSAPIMMSSACGSCAESMSGCRQSITTSATCIVDETSVAQNGVAYIRAPIETFDAIGRQYCLEPRGILGTESCYKSRMKGKES